MTDNENVKDFPSSQQRATVALGRLVKILASLERELPDEVEAQEISKDLDLVRHLRVCPIGDPNLDELVDKFKHVVVSSGSIKSSFEVLRPVVEELLQQLGGEVPR